MSLTVIYLASNMNFLTDRVRIRHSNISFGMEEFRPIGWNRRIEHHNPRINRDQFTVSHKYRNAEESVVRRRGIHHGFETQDRRRRHHKSKKGISVAPRKRTRVLQFFFKKYRKVDCYESNLGSIPCQVCFVKSFLFNSSNHTTII